jgi:hypothetical protein
MFNHVSDWPTCAGQLIIVLAIGMHFLMVRKIYWQKHREDKEERAKYAAQHQASYAELLGALGRILEALKSVQAQKPATRKKPEVPGQQEGI